jgi:hypothetical protein
MLAYLGQQMRRQVGLRFEPAQAALVGQIEMEPAEGQIGRGFAMVQLTTPWAVWL